METIAIIAEYNPFHNGHAHQIAQVRQRFPRSTILIIMSGPFMQRGTPSLWSHFDRARWAVTGGADAVFQLPSIFSLSSAEGFALGGVSMAQLLGATHLAFGSETADVDAIVQWASVLDADSTQAQIKRYMQCGNSYGESLRQVAVTTGHSFALQPNSLLGVEYVRAIQRSHATIEPVVIHRESQHHDETLEGHFVSGTALRNYIELHEHVEGLASYIPRNVYEAVHQQVVTGHWVNVNDYYRWLHGYLRMLPVDVLAQIAGISEGVEQRIKKGAIQETYDAFWQKVVSKRYTRSRIERVGTCAVLGIHKSLQREAFIQGVTYARLLAMNEQGVAWLKQHKDIPLVTKWGPSKQQASAYTQRLMDIDEKATDLQALFFHNDEYRRASQDFHHSPKPQ